MALLVSPAPAVAARDALVAAGRLVPAKAPFRLPVRRILADGGEPASVIHAELREERLL